MSGKIAKEILILILLCVVVIFVLGILLYDFIPGKDEKIKSVEYKTDQSVSEVLDEIKANTGIDIQEKSDVPLKSYSIEASDLDIYASENSYESGKIDPFAESSAPADESFKTTATKATATENQSNIFLNIENKVEETATKEETKNTVSNNVSEGKFFEKSNSK